MCDTSRTALGAASEHRVTTDRGMTLPELLIAIAVIGIVATVLTAGVSVTLRQHGATEGRLDVARWEQNLGMWLPDDLSSAATTDDDPTLTPCGASSCGGVDMSTGSNVLLLSWTEDGATTTVSYRYQPDGDDRYGLFRVECGNGGCDVTRVLGDLAPPPPPWAPGDRAPDAVISVDYPLTSDPADSDGIDDTAGRRRITVSVNGVPAVDGVDRSSRVSLAAGGTTLSTIPPAQFTGPSFVEAASDCGGPITLIVDESGSIGGDMDEVADGVESFINLFDGTPTWLQVIPFNNRSTVLDPFGEGTWNVWLDMSEPGNAQALIGELDTLVAGGTTNWEDALYRTFYTAGNGGADSGVPHSVAGNPSAPMPELVVFFTDGLPTRDRTQSRSGSPMSLGTAPWPHDQTGSSFSPRALWRANQIAANFRGNDGDAVRILGLGVGPSFGHSRNVPNWPENPYPHRKFLGNLVAGGDPTDRDDNPYVTRTWTGGDGWGDVSTADMLIATDFTRFADALADIALAECGGTLTVQTRLTDGTPAQFDQTYTAGVEQVTTSRIAKSGTFDVDMAGAGSATVQVIPESTDLAAGGVTALSWGCRAKGADLVLGTDYQLIDPADPAAGVEVTVRANGATSCTLTVGP